jgi:hypothetical protein
MPTANSMDDPEALAPTTSGSGRDLEGEKIALINRTGSKNLRAAVTHAAPQVLLGLARASPSAMGTAGHNIQVPQGPSMWGSEFMSGIGKRSVMQYHRKHNDTQAWWFTTHSW